MHLDNANGVTKDLRISSTDNNITDNNNISEEYKTSTGYCRIWNTKYNNKNKHEETDSHKQSVNDRKLVYERWREKVNKELIIKTCIFN